VLEARSHRAGFCVRHGHDGQERSKDLFGHEGVRHSDVFDDGGLDVLGFAVRGAAVCDFPPGLVQQSDESIVVALVDDVNDLVFAVILEILADPVGSAFYEFIMHAWVDEDVVT